MAWTFLFSSTYKGANHSLVAWEKTKGKKVPSPVFEPTTFRLPHLKPYQLATDELFIKNLMLCHATYKLLKIFVTTLIMCIISTCPFQIS